jgi:hypothetical protein
MEDFSERVDDRMRGVMLYRMIKFLSRAELEGKLSVSD